MSYIAKDTPKGRPFVATEEIATFISEFTSSDSLKHIPKLPSPNFAYNPLIILLMLKRHTEIVSDVPNLEVLCKIKIGQYSYVVHTAQYPANNQWAKYEECSMEAAGKVFVMLHTLIFGDEFRSKYPYEYINDYENHMQTIREHKKLLAYTLLQHSPLALNSEYAEYLLQLIENPNIYTPVIPGLIIPSKNCRSIIAEKMKIQPRWSLKSISEDTFEIYHPTYRHFIASNSNNNNVKSASTGDLPPYIAQKNTRRDSSPISCESSPSPSTSMSEENISIQSSDSLPKTMYQQNHPANGNSKIPLDQFVKTNRRSTMNKREPAVIRSDST